MGQVFAATHETLGRSFAIKFLTAGLTSSQEASLRFQDEIRSLGQMQHANIVSAVDAGVKNGIHYLVTDYVAGQTLSELVANEGPIKESRVLEIARQISEGLAHAHRVGFVHRDIKPSNLIMDESGTVRILDFGIARHTNGTSSLTADGQMLGTAEFLAPEQAADAQSVDGRSDLYSLGGTLLFLLTGETPFPKTSHPTFASQLHAHLFETPPALMHPRPEWSGQLRGLLTKLLARNPDERFSSAEEVADFLSGQSVIVPAASGRSLRWVTLVTIACAVLVGSVVFSSAMKTGGSDTGESLATATPWPADSAVAQASSSAPNSAATFKTTEETATPAKETEPLSPEPEPNSESAATPESDTPTTASTSTDGTTDAAESSDLLDVQTVNTNSARSAGRAPATFPGKLSGGGVRHKPGIRSGAPQ